jgi:hypothetical protein
VKILRTMRKFCPQRALGKLVFAEQQIRMAKVSVERRQFRPDATRRFELAHRRLPFALRV